jgi:CTP synthase
VAVQYHPEFKSKPTAAHPLFAGFVEAAVEYRATRHAAAGKRPASSAPAEPPCETEEVA